VIICISKARVCHQLTPSSLLSLQSYASALLPSDLGIQGYYERLARLKAVQELQEAGNIAKSVMTLREIGAIRGQPLQAGLLDRESRKELYNMVNQATPADLEMYIEGMKDVERLALVVSGAREATDQAMAAAAAEVSNSWLLVYFDINGQLTMLPILSPVLQAMNKLQIATSACHMVHCPAPCQFWQAEWGRCPVDILVKADINLVLNESVRADYIKAIEEDMKNIQEEEEEEEAEAASSKRLRMLLE
jgi:hypothetical protein